MAGTAAWSPGDIFDDALGGSPIVGTHDYQEDFSDHLCPIGDPLRHFFVPGAPLPEYASSHEFLSSEWELDLLDESLLGLSPEQASVLVSPKHVTKDDLRNLTDEELGDVFRECPQLVELCDESFWRHRLSQNFAELWVFALTKPGSVTFTWRGLYNEASLLPRLVWTSSGPFEIGPENLLHPVIVRFLDSKDNFCFSKAVFDVCEQNIARVKKYAELELRLVNHAELLDEYAQRKRIDLVLEFLYYGYFPSECLLSDLLDMSIPRIDPFLLKVLITQARPRAQHVFNFWTGRPGRKLIKLVLGTFPRNKKYEGVCLNPCIREQFEKLRDKTMLRLIDKFASL